MEKVNLTLISDSLQKSLKRMNALEMLIFYFRIEKNLTYKEISQKLCISQEMVRLHLKKIYEYIKKEIND